MSSLKQILKEKDVIEDAPPEIAFFLLVYMFGQRDKICFDICNLLSKVLKLLGKCSERIQRNQSIKETCLAYIAFLKIKLMRVLAFSIDQKGSFFIQMQITTLEASLRQKIKMIRNINK